MPNMPVIRINGLPRGGKIVGDTTVIGDGDGIRVEVGTTIVGLGVRVEVGVGEGKATGAREGVGLAEGGVGCDRIDAKSERSDDLEEVCRGFRVKS